MESKIIEALSYGPLLSKELANKLKKKRVKDIQKSIDTLLKENLISKYKLGNNVQYSLVTDTDKNVDKSTPVQIDVKDFDSLKALNSVLLGIVDHYKTEILFLRDQLRNKDHFFEQQQNIMDSLIKNNTFKDSSEKKVHRNSANSSKQSLEFDQSITLNSIDETKASTINSSLSTSNETPNSFLIIDEQSDLENKDTQTNPPLIENNFNRNRHQRKVPGNSTYANLTEKGKKCAILSDSICRRINMKILNEHIKRGYAIRKTYIGASPQELEHYMIKPIVDENPDSCVINIGINKIGKEDPKEIVKNILKCVKKCREYGIQDIMVSSLTFRPNFQAQIHEVNSLLFEKSNELNFFFIDNDNIRANHIWRDNLHLNDMGRDILANNIINAINLLHARAD